MDIVGTPEIRERFSVGSLLKISFENFLTYSKAELYPGPNLNVVVGPNGTGKSTIICAICLALGGHPKALGRSEKMTDYIKYGCQKSSVTIHIKISSSKDLVTTIMITPNKTTYYLDQKAVTQAELRQTVAKFKIQVDNPCAFLAQDKIRSFAEQNANALLWNTERALDPKLHDLHDAVVRLKQQESIDATNLKKMKDKLADVQNEIEKLKPIVENYQQCAALRERIELFQTRLCYLNCVVQMRAVEGNNRLLDDKCVEFEKAHAAKKKYMDVIGEEKALFEKEENDLDKAIADLSLVKEEVQNALRTEQPNTLMEHAKAEYERALKEFEEWEKKVSYEENEKNVLAEKLQHGDEEIDSMKEKQVELRAEYNKWSEKEEELDRRKMELFNAANDIRSKKGALDEERNIEKQQRRERFAILEGTNESMSCGDAWRWYQSHKEQFRYPVYIPLLMMDLTDDDSAMYLENIVSQRDLSMFIFGCKEDELLLNNSSNRFTINSCTISREEVDKYTVQKAITQQMHSLGFSRMASDLFNAPPPVKAYLNSVAKLSKIPIGNQEAESRIGEICDTLRQTHRLFLTKSSKVQIIISKYGGNLSVRTSSLRKNPRFLTAHIPTRGKMDKSKLEKEEAELIAKERQLNEEQQRYEQEMKRVAQGREACRSQMNEYQKMKVARNVAAQQLRMKSARLEMMKKNKPDWKAAAAALAKAEKECVALSFQRARKIGALLEKRRDLVISAGIASLRLRTIQNKVLTNMEHLDSFYEDVHEKAEAVRECMQFSHDLKKKAKESVQEFCERTGIASIEEDKLSDADKESLETLLEKFRRNCSTEDPDEVEAMIIREQGKLDAMHTEGEKKDIERYEHLEEELDHLTKELQKANKKVDNWKASFENALDDWLKPLEDAILKINKYFSDFFCCLGSEGQATLQKPGDKCALKEYGIVIATKFRKEERLRQLTHMIQSGGERSVATMLYILALQKWSSVPFKCIDEINQGMDPMNERLVFELIVQVLSEDCESSKTQYFMLTPKLLPRLKFGKDVDVHFVYNGPSLENRENWRMANFINATKSRLLSSEVT